MNPHPHPIPLRFGIASLDTLICPEHVLSGIENVEKKGIWTAAIVGPDGCGKSILALHLASTYWRDHCVNDPTLCVIYASTDLSIDQAHAQWANFGLDYPEWREESVKASYANRNREIITPNFNVALHKLSQIERIDMVDVLKRARSQQPTETSYGDASPTQEADVKATHAAKDFVKHNHVLFVDLQSETAGDDWGFINHLLGLLPRRQDGPHREDNKAKHLLIIDAVEGLEAYVGEQDAFGKTRDRRSRIAQLIRQASAIGVHLVFVVEEPNTDARLPEQFVTDLVLRLRHNVEDNYTQRTVEIEKCRAIPHIRGQHEFAIRRGGGTSTGKDSNLDDPRIYWKNLSDSPGVPSKLYGKSVGTNRIMSQSFSPRKPDLAAYLAHIHVIPSLYYHNRKIRDEKSDVPELVGVPDFGLEALDELLKTKFGAREHPLSGSLGVLLGEAGTHKGRLARRFLTQAFRRNGRNLDKLEETGAAILLSTRLIDRGALITRICRHLAVIGTNSEANIRQILSLRVLCHRFSARHLSCGAFISIIQRYVREAQKRLLGWTDETLDAAPKNEIALRKLRGIGYKIRVVLEDWNNLLASFPNLMREPLLLSTVISLLHRNGVSALLVSTQPGQPGISATNDAHELRNLDEPQILTWMVPFFGDRRVAITAHAIRAPRHAPMICELESDEDDEILKVNRHFDLYADVDIGRPRRVPLRVRLYLGKYAHVDSEGSDTAFTRLLRNTFLQMFPGSEGQESILLDSPNDYEAFFTYADMLDDLQLDYTLVMQIDEFWLAENSIGLYDLSAYWRATVASCKHTTPLSNTESIKQEDPYSAYLPQPDCFDDPKKNDPTPQIWSAETAKQLKEQSDNNAGYLKLRRENFFLGNDDGCDAVHWKISNEVHRIPYLWDFGILLADRDLWTRHEGLKVLESGHSVGQIWNYLCRATDKKLQIKLSKDRVKTPLPPISWNDFLDACSRIAALEQVPAFDVDLTTAESLSSWVFELWASFEESQSPSNEYELFEKLTSRSIKPEIGLRDLLQRCDRSLLSALVALVHYCPQLRSRDRNLYREHLSKHCVASREWYSTASAKMKESSNTRYVPLALPGTHSVRGDWHLVVAKGSRSEVLARRTLDLLSSRRANLLRLQDGIGLPVRDILPDCQIGGMPTAMVCHYDDSQDRKTLSYRDICSLGKRKQASEDDRPLKWLWRSRIKWFHRDSFYWRRWLARMIEEQHQWFPPMLRTVEKLRVLLSSDHTDWVAFKKNKTNSLGPLKEVFHQFNKRLQLLLVALRETKS